MAPPSIEVVRALDAAAPERFRAAIALGAGAGLRQGEVFGLTVDRVDFEAGSVRVARQLVTPNLGPPEFGPPKRPASIRRVPVGRVVADILRAHTECFEPGPEGLVFTTAAGAAVGRNRSADLMRATAKRAKIGRCGSTSCATSTRRR